MAAVQPAHAQGPTVGWSASPCDAQGNPLTSPLLRNGFYQMGGTKSGTASNTYPAPWVASLGSSPSNGGASPLTVTTIPTMSADPSVGIAGYPTYGSFASNELTDGTYYYTVNGSSCLINGSVTTHIDGQLVYYFLVQWSGGGAPTGPLPPAISLLLNTNLLANAQLNYGTSKQTSGLSASASAADSTFQETASSTGPTSVTGYHLVQASVSPLTASTGIAQVSLNGTVDQTASDQVPAGAYVAGHGYLPPNGSAPAVANSTTASANSEVSAGVKPFNIQLVQPDPNKDATLGDVENQFVYSADTPDGYLYIPGAIQVVGGTHADAQMLLDNNLVDLKIETSPIPNTFVHQWAISGSTIYVNTPQNTDNPYPGYQFNHWIFKGLPNSFSTIADGNHNVNLYVQGTKTQTAKIQTFFNAGASNWSGSDGTTPNWYHYYNSVYPSAPITFDPNLTGPAGATDVVDPNTLDPDWDPPATYFVEPNLWIYPKQAIGSKVIAGYDLAVFDLNGTVPGMPTRKFVRYVGSLSLKGILSYVNAVSHEKAHVTLIKRGICYPWNQSPPLQYRNDQGMVQPYSDTDRDTLDDTWEVGHHLLPGNPDTTGHFPNYSDPVFPRFGTGDLECLTEILVLNDVFNNYSLWQNDWADQGIQYAGGSPLYFKPPDFYLQFTAAVNGNTFVAGSTHPVRSLQDIRNEYPTLLTDVP